MDLSGVPTDALIAELRSRGGLSVSVVPVRPGMVELSYRELVDLLEQLGAIAREFPRVVDELVEARRRLALVEPELEALAGIVVGAADVDGAIDDLLGSE